MINILRTINISIFLTALTSILQYLPDLQEHYHIRLLGYTITPVMLIIILFLILIMFYSVSYIKLKREYSYVTLNDKEINIGHKILPFISSGLQIMFLGYIYLIMRRTGNFFGEVIDNVIIKVEKVQSSVQI